MRTVGGGPITAIYRDATTLCLFMPGNDGTCWGTHTLVSGSPYSPSGIKHVFVLMLENRSLDHMLGWSGITGKDAVTNTDTMIEGLSASDTNSYKGVPYKAGTTAPNSMPVDPGHEFPDVLTQLTGSASTWQKGHPHPTPITNSGFVDNYVAQKGYAKNGGGQPAQSMNSFTPATLPVLSKLAEEFVVCDHWYSSMPGPTWPNRFFVHAASSGGLDHSPNVADLAQAYTRNGYRFKNGNIFDRLNGAQIPWRIYAGDRTPQSGGMQGMFYWSSYWFSGFVNDIKDPSYAPAYTFIEPDYGAIASDYP